MENEMKALAQSLALFLNTEATVSGMFKERFWISDMAKGLFSALITRNIPKNFSAAAAGGRNSDSFFYRYISAAQKNADFENINIPAAKTEEHFNEIAAARFTELTMGMADGVLSNGVTTELLTREKTVENYKTRPFARLNTAENRTVEMPLQNQIVYKAKQPADVLKGLSKTEIGRISDALGEQLHQKLAAGFPMYMR